MGESADPKKLLLPYLQRADELQKHEPLVAYYCRLYAMERGLKIPSKERGKTVNGVLMSLMNQLEKDKKVVKISPDDNMYVEGFASRVFAKADKQDRAGRADLSTAKTFYASSLFFDVLHQFGELPPDIEQRLKYAIWKAADIRKALSEGRKPVPGPPGGDEEFLEGDGMTWDTEGSPQKVVPTSSPPRHQTDGSQHQEEFPSAGAGHMLPRSNSLSQVPPTNPTPLSPTHSMPMPPSNSMPMPPSNFMPMPPTNSMSMPPTDQMPMPPANAPPPQSVHHNRQPSADEIDLPSAPTTQPIYPGHYQSGFPSPSPYAPPHYTADAGPPPIHDWSGGNSRKIDSPPHPSAFGHPHTSHDDYNGNAGNFSSYAPSNAQNPYGGPIDQGYSYSQFPSAPTTGYQGGTTYPSVPPSESYNSGYVEPQHHQRTVSAPPGISGQVNGISYPTDSGYQPPPDKVAEAHKAARFAVSALAFDDVPTALEFLRKSLELLTIPTRAT